MFIVLFSTNLLAHSTDIKFDTKANCTKKKINVKFHFKIKRL